MSCSNIAVDQRQPGTAASRGKILVIYDDPRSEWTVRQILEPAGYDVITVSFGPIAMAVFHKRKPGLAVLDGLSAREVGSGSLPSD